MRCPARLTWLAVIALAAACGTEPDPPDAIAARTPLECEVQGYPCTWNEVSPEVARHTRALAQVGALYERSGATMAEVAAFLRDQPAVAAVQAIGTGVRFRLDDGRPAWVYPGNELAHHRGEPAAAGETGARPVSRERSSLAPGRSSSVTPPPDVGLLDRLGAWLSPALRAQEADEAKADVNDDQPGTGKRALILAPFEWQFPGHGQKAASWIEQTRDYRTEAGGELIYHADLAEYEANPTGPHLYLDGEVQFADFLEWDTYNLVILLSHGTVHYCKAIPPAAGERRISGQTPDGYPPEEDCPLIWAGRAKQDSYGPYIGVEIVEYFDPVDEPHPGLTVTEAAFCAAQLAVMAGSGNDWPEVQTPGGKPCQYMADILEGERLALWTPFFEHQYPQGLQNAVVMLAACRSAVNDHLLKILAPDGNRSVAVFGFDNSVDAGEGLELTAELTRMIHRGVKSHELEELLKGWDRTSFLVGRTLALGDEPATGPAEVRLESPTAMHGRDIVLLIDPATGEELRDGGTVRVASYATEETDLLRVYPQLLGVTDAQPGDGERLQVRVVGEQIPSVSYRPLAPVDEYAFRYTGPVALGRRHQPNEIVDLEVLTELPGGARGTGGASGMTPFPGFSLAIGAQGGLGAGQYPVGTDETLGMAPALMRNAHPDTFFAHLSANLTNPIPNLPAGYPSAGSFFSIGGHVSIDYIDATRIEGSFSVQVRALVPAEGLFNENIRPVDATATGDFAGTFAPLRELLAGIDRGSEVVYDCTPPSSGGLVQ